ncbi:cytochrome c oxidase cbb3-type subunit III [Sphingobium sp. SYK-6]|uniref:cytochrome-c oxidase, cbb3-type subunit III n=1 Tax=Sphingobium sp. (strain NBRC 103272 / SYK-6) TaxID=627192 RepID=UPI0002277FDB|nr:cytochrome-c oxidase, cbb3-type subunit III [Sphingobium sp. SYK-6]BAK68512.1 cytochrome c oxidase cbb3-type subunit III [Sphingobium sp. SYK-6]
MAEQKRIDQPTGTETVGHEWDGIEELNTPLPRWWLWTFYATIVFSIGYIVVYPALPGLTGATKGVFGWSSRGALAETMETEGARKAPILSAIAVTPIEQLPAKPELMNAAVQGGAAAFRTHCVQCHGSGASGSKGYPNLNDDDWLWGGDLKTLEYTITHGIRNPDEAETRNSLMPAFGHDGILTAPQVQDTVSFVRVISGHEKQSASSRRGAALFEANCAVCHGPQGKGMREFGAPNLTDGIWLYGGDRETLTQTINNSRRGVMPAWRGHLSPTTIKMLAAYVHSRGGGEATPPPAPVETAQAEGGAAPAAAPAN